MPAGAARNAAIAMWIGSLTLDLRFGDVRSLKEKRSLVRPIVAELRRKLAVSAAETGNLDLHRRAEVGVAVVAADRAHCVEVISACEQLVAGRPELEVLSVWVRYFTDSDLSSDGDLLPDGTASPGGSPFSGRGTLAGRGTTDGEGR
jgi:uncharacterized protein YlxP (DUF503 family)